MILLNWLPELILLALLFFTLILMNFGNLSYRSISLVITGVATFGLTYFVMREDLSYFESPLKVIISDSLSHFGKIISLLSLALFSLSVHFHRNLNYQEKQSSCLFLLFYSTFTIGLFQSNSLIFFLGSALGVYLSSMNLILIESGKDPEWVLLFRQRTVSVGLWAILISIIFILGTFLFGSVYLSDWIEVFGKYSGSELPLFGFGFLLFLASTIPLGGLRYEGKAPLGIAMLCYGFFLVLVVFWLRFTVPFFSLSSVMSKNLSQILLSLVIGGLTLRYGWNAIRAREHHRWYSSALPTVVGLCLFLVLLPSEHALPAFYCISFSLLFTFGLVSTSFISDTDSHKSIVLVGLIGLVGMSPFVLGELYYRLIRDAVASGNLVAGILMTLAWLGLTIAVIRKISSVLLTRSILKDRRKILLSEMFFVGIYFACVIGLTIFRSEFVTLLNERPVTNLW